MLHIQSCMVWSSRTGTECHFCIALVGPLAHLCIDVCRHFKQVSKGWDSVHLQHTTFRCTPQWLEKHVVPDMRSASTGDAA